jgi:putative transposase
MFAVIERCLSNVVDKYGLHSVSSDRDGTRYPQACKFSKLKHHLHSIHKKSIIQRTIQYIKDRTENFDDYFPHKKRTRVN